MTKCYYLAGDVGGTNSRLEFYSISSGDSLADVRETLIAAKTYPSQQYPSLTLVVKRFFKDINVTEGNHPSAGCIAVAGPIKNGNAHLTNVGWVIDIKEMQADLNIPNLKLINDLEGCGYGLLVLQDEDLVAVNNVPSEPNAPIAVIGAGTGLGEAYLTKNEDEYIVWPSEGGHTDYGPKTQLECELMFDIKEKKGISRVSVERVVSGMGILSTYKFLAKKFPELVDPKVEEELKACETNMEGAVITRYAKKSTTDDVLCKQAINMFVSNYGSEAGNMALKTLCFGGMYIAGGIAPHMIDIIKEGTFMKSYLDKGRLKEMLMEIPVYIVMHKSVNMLGARVVCRRILRKSGHATGDDLEVIASTEAEARSHL